MSRSSTDDSSASGEPRKLLEVGKIIRPHGLAGDVIVDLVSNRLERLDPGSVLVGRGAAGAEGEDAELKVVSSRPHQHRFIVRFEDVTSHACAEDLRDTVLLAEPIEDADAMFVHELIGCEVVEVSGRSHGFVVAVQYNPASDLLMGESGWLVPLRFVVRREADRLVVDAPEGLFE